MEMTLKQILDKYCPDKEVLEIGCAGQSYKFRVHQMIKKCNPSYLMGIDIQEEEIERGKKQGFNVMVGNIEDDLLLMDIDKKFDVVVMTEVIEHLNNTGLAIGNIWNLMKPNGVLIITTPNCFAPKWLQQLKDKGKTNTNVDHVMWFDRQTLVSLFGRHNMKIDFLNELLNSTIIAVVRRK
jgi:2-polyprenyl-3-methyl-5-hydroxy-6-metoxy-1,4-benzoquinol methylase